MPQRRTKSFQHGKAKQGAAIYHHEHRSKKNRRRLNRGTYLYKDLKRKKLLLLEKEQKEEWMILKK